MPLTRGMVLGMPRVLRVDPEAPDPSAIAEAAAVLARGGLVAFPTETVYGLGARGLHASEVARIFVAKGRPAGHPVILHVDGEAMAKLLAGAWPSAASRLVADLWPGPLTLVVPRAASVPPQVTGGLATVGLRAPAHPVALALIRALGEPIAAPSANAHTHVSPTTAAHVVRSLGERVDLVLDGGACAHGIESTVVEVGAALRVLRPGAVSLSRLREIDPEIAYEVATIDGDEARASPGMASKHYAPSARVVIAPRGAVADAIAEVSRASGNAAAGATLRVSAIVSTEAGRRAAQGCALPIVLPDSPEGYAQGLFAALHAVDESRIDVVVIEAVPPGDTAWWAVADRLARAARR
jgi:L-threonylcarbamoyladenylate synthase